MERQVVRVVTPGTVTDDALLEQRRETLLAAAACEGERFGLAWLDLASGRFSVLQSDERQALEAELERLRPAELLLAEDQAAADASGAARHGREIAAALVALRARERLAPADRSARHARSEGLRRR